MAQKELRSLLKGSYTTSSLESSVGATVHVFFWAW